MEAYNGIRIDDEVIIVERPLIHLEEDTIPQGYVVNIQNEKMLATAKEWARNTEYIRDENNKIIYENGKPKIVEHEGIVHTYKNGTFDFVIYDSADGSSQGGKLSFWTAIIKAPDEKEFRVGINADILLDLLKYNTFVNGACTNKVWLGRIKGNRVGAFTETMPDFEKAKQDEKIRNIKPTVKYEIGDILKAKSGEVLIYMGEQTEYFSMQRLWDKKEWGKWKNTVRFEHDYALVIDDKPEKYFCYWEVSGSDLTEDNIKNKSIFSTSKWLHCRKEKKRLSRIVDGHIDIDISTYWTQELEYQIRQLNSLTGQLKSCGESYLSSLTREIQKAKTKVAIANAHRELSQLSDVSFETVEKFLTVNFELFVNVEEFEQEYENTGKSDQVKSIMKQSDFIKYANEINKELARYGHRSYIYRTAVHIIDRDWKLEEVN